MCLCVNHMILRKLIVAASLVEGSRAWAQLLLGKWNLRRPGMQPVSPALAGGFLITEPPQKPPVFFKQWLPQIKQTH